MKAYIIDIKNNKGSFIAQLRRVKEKDTTILGVSSKVYSSVYDILEDSWFVSLINKDLHSDSDMLGQQLTICTNYKPVVSDWEVFCKDTHRGSRGGKLRGYDNSFMDYLTSVQSLPLLISMVYNPAVQIKEVNFNTQTDTGVLTNRPTTITKTMGIDDAFEGLEEESE
jgi:hypothetical protein